MSYIVNVDERQGLLSNTQVAGAYSEETVGSVRATGVPTVSYGPIMRYKYAVRSLATSVYDNKIPVNKHCVQMFFSYTGFGALINAILGWALVAAWLFSLVYTFALIYILDQLHCANTDAGTDGCNVGSLQRGFGPWVYLGAYFVLGWYVLIVFKINKSRLSAMPLIHLVNQYIPTTAPISGYGWNNEFFTYTEHALRQGAIAAVQNDAAFLAYFRERNITQIHFHLFNSNWRSRYYDLALGFGIYYWIMAIDGTINIILYSIIMLQLR